MASITGDTLQEQIQKAISAHGVFKFKLAHMVEAQTNEIQPPTAAADNLCPVGQWLYEGLAPEARSGDHYRTVVELHARFHHAAGEVATLSLARRRTEALEAMELTSSFKRISDQLVEALEAWATAVGGGAAEPAPGPAPVAEAGLIGGAARGAEATPVAEPQSIPEMEPVAEPEPAAEPEPVAEPEPAAEPEAMPEYEPEADETSGPDEGGEETASEPPPGDDGADSIKDWFGLPPIRESGEGGGEPREPEGY